MDFNYINYYVCVDGGREREWDTGRKKGRKGGREEGRKEGMKGGRKEGREEGRKERPFDTGIETWD